MINPELAIQAARYRAAGAILLYLLALGADKGPIRMSGVRLSRALGYAPGTVVTALNHLESLGVLVYTPKSADTTMYVDLSRWPREAA